MAKRPSFILNFRFVGNAQTGRVYRTGANQARNAKGQFTALDNFARVLVEDIALNTAQRTYVAAKEKLVAQVRTVVAAEIAMMARMISRFIVQPENATGPKGIIRAADTNVSQQAKSLWGKGSNIIQYDLSNSDAYWHPRTKRYVEWKRKHNHPTNWWKLTGQLKDKLAQPALYYDFGPISVSFSKGGNDPGESKVKQTASGRSGKVSKKYEVGKLEVAVFGKITPEMLPAILDAGNSGVGHASPNSYPYVPTLFKDDDVKNKLLGRGEYRPVVEPFIAYYLTRAIPNAVFNRTERLISDIGSAGVSRGANG